MKTTCCLPNLIRPPVRLAAVMLAGAMLLAPGPLACDAPTPEAPAPAGPPSAPTPPAADAAPSRRPTTQQLVEGDWKTVPVSILPLTIKVPASWRTEDATDAGLMTIEGWTPTGFAQLRAAARPGLSQDTFDGFIRSARTDAESRGANLKKFELRPGEPMTLLERQIASAEQQDMPTMDDAGNLVDRRATPLRWSFLVFLKKESGRFDCYELWFDALSLEHFEQDKDFFARIAESLTYDASRKPD